MCFSANDQKIELQCILLANVAVTLAENRLKEFLRFTTQEKMYNYMPVSREKWWLRRQTPQYVNESDPFVDIPWRENNF